MTGIALYFGAFIIAAWAYGLASGEDSYRFVTGLLGSPLSGWVAGPRKALRDLTSAA